LKAFDSALWWSIGLHAAIFAAWQFVSMKPQEPAVVEVATPMVVSLTLPEVLPSAPVSAKPEGMPQRTTPSAARSMVPVTPAIARPAQTPINETAVVALPDVDTSVQVGAAPAPTPAISTATSTTATSSQLTAKNPGLELPSSDADYLHNPKPAYPPMSRRLGEQGKVLVRVFIDASGQPQQAEVKQSSGFERLDQTALNTVLKWRYLPGKRNGTPEAMWLQVPLEFKLE
jgi:protein TonB